MKDRITFTGKAAQEMFEALAAGKPPLAGATGSAFVREAIMQRLKELRTECALRLGMLEDSKTGFWEPSKYWQDMRVKTILEGKEKAHNALKSLEDFVAEHRPIMGAAWMRKHNGRLCWAKYLGGYPIDTHYCIRPEGHKGRHHDTVGWWRRQNSEVSSGAKTT